MESKAEIIECKVVRTKVEDVCIRCGSHNLLSFANDYGKGIFYICKDCRRIFTPEDVIKND